jgi:hypothetical protein
LVPVLFTFYIQGVLKQKIIIPAPKVNRVGVEYTLIDTNLCKPDDVQARPKHVVDVTSCRIQLSVVLCKDGLIKKIFK